MEYMRLRNIIEELIMLDKNYKIGLLKGDGIGPEIANSVVKIIEASFGR